MHVSAADKGDLHSASPWLYVNSRGPLNGQGIGAAPVRNREINMASLVKSPHIEGSVGFDDPVIHQAGKELVGLNPNPEGGGGGMKRITRN